VIIKSIIANNFGVNVWIVGDHGKCIVIDPGGNSDKVIEAINKLNLELEYIFLTHSHPDHLYGAKKMQTKYKKPVYIHSSEMEIIKGSVEYGKMIGFDNLELPDEIIPFNQDDKLKFGDLVIEVIHTPGHSPGSVCFKIEDCLFSGDTLFKQSVGRTDLPGGSWDKLEKSLKILKNLEPKTKIFPGHGPMTTLEEELKNNSYLSS